MVLIVTRTGPSNSHRSSHLVYVVNMHVSQKLSLFNTNPVNAVDMQGNANFYCALGVIKDHSRD